MRTGSESPASGKALTCCSSSSLSPQSATSRRRRLAVVGRRSWGRGSHSPAAGSLSRRFAEQSGGSGMPLPSEVVIDPRSSLGVGALPLIREKE